jgi:hypothetical protein
MSGRSRGARGGEEPVNGSRQLKEAPGGSRAEAWQLKREMPAGNTSAARYTHQPVNRQPGDMLALASFIYAPALPA